MAQTEKRREYDRRRYALNREAKRAQVAEYRRKNPEKVKALKVKWAKKNPLGQKARTLKYYYGLTLAQYDELLIASCGRCAICNAQFENAPKEPNVDHDHETDEVRGLLCGRCNKAIGFMDDDPERLVAAAEYLKRR